MDAKYFPKNYNESRNHFREQALALKAQIGEWKIPGQKDDDLYVDHAYWPALEKPQTLLVVTSGIHGSETYAGAAILNMFMTEIFKNVDRKNMGVFLVHALNPFGFKHHQRTTEAGVNLNRNFSVSGELYKTKNEDSARLHQKFYSRQPVTSDRSDLIQSIEIKGDSIYFGDISLDQFTKSVSPGQFDGPENLEYGGKALEPQTKLLIEKIKSIMPLYQDVVGLDLHSGLGDKNRLHLLTSGSDHDLHPELFAKLFHQKEDHDIYAFTPASTEGFYQVKGALNSMFVELAMPKQRICTITMEFGTFGHSLDEQLEGLNSSLLSHQGRYYGFATKELENKIQKNNFEKSYPQTDEWRNAVIAASRGLFERILKRV
ncbi:MAG: DUF2817 domain-containing protein [Bdellovibrio sp.]|nr:DUF2817 domain-containing protein [Bdellovibrio sp.]